MDRLHRLVAQHAETSRLMGVDFVPSFRRGGTDAAAIPSDNSPSQGPSEGPHAPHTSVEPKPVARAAPAEALINSAYLPMIDGPHSRDRAEVQRCLDLLRARYEADAPHKNFVTDHHSIVFGDGDPCARLVFIGEAPGEEEDKQGIPFVGRAGQLLNKMIDAMGLSRSAVYICNVLKTRPPNNATPTSEEARLCAPYLVEQIRIINPDVIVTLGLPATKCVLGVEATMASLRGRWHQMPVANSLIPVMPTYHPAFLLRAYTPENRRKVWSDLKLAMDRLGEGAAAHPASAPPTARP